MSERPGRSKRSRPPDNAMGPHRELRVSGGYALLSDPTHAGECNFSLALKDPVQMVIAATEQDFVGDNLADSIARPQFGEKDHPRFFGPPESIAHPKSKSQPDAASCATGPTPPDGIVDVGVKLERNGRDCSLTGGS